VATIIYCRDIARVRHIGDNLVGYLYVICFMWENGSSSALGEYRNYGAFV